MKFNGIEVCITPTSEYPLPYGKKYKAKGCYIQKKEIVVVGLIKDDGYDNTIRIKYPLADVDVKFL